MRIIPVLAAAALAVVASYGLASAQATNVAPRSGTAPALQSPSVQTQPAITGTVRKAKKSKKHKKRISTR
jgi:hypothetical protein